MHGATRVPGGERIRKFLLAFVFAALVAGVEPAATHDPPDGSDPCENCRYLAGYMYRHMGRSVDDAATFLINCYNAWDCL